MPLLLGIETSCDETAAAVVADGRDVLSSIVASQHDLHEKYAGVVPEIASRAHLERITPTIQEALDRAGTTFDRLDAVAVGNRPGLIGSLLVGVSAAKAIAWAADKPLIGIDHIQAHLYAAELHEGRGPRAEGREEAPDKTSSSSALGSRPSDLGAFPALGLVVSGGHTTLYALASPTDMTPLGRTIDDAVGEAYDKAAVILRAGYPGGPRLDKLAQRGGPSKQKLPRSLLGPDSLDFSFSGLKTALLYKVRGVPAGRGETSAFERTGKELSDADRADLAAAFQEAAIGMLVTKMERAIDRMAAEGRPPRRLIIGGGVSANSLLRRRAAELGERRGLEVGIPTMSFCVDNAAMIAGLAYHHLTQRRFDDLDLPAIATTAM